MLLGRRRRGLLVVEALDLGDSLVEVAGPAVAAGDRADVALAVDEELDVGRGGEHAVRGRDRLRALGGDGKEDARLAADALDRVAGVVDGDRDHFDAEQSESAVATGDLRQSGTRACQVVQDE